MATGTLGNCIIVFFAELHTYLTFLKEKKKKRKKTSSFDTLRKEDDTMFNLILIIRRKILANKIEQHH